MKKFIAGAVFGALIMASTSVFADGGLQSITAFLKPDLPITMDGKKVDLETTPIIYQDTTYLPLRETATVMGKEVKWNGETKTVELYSSETEQTGTSDSKDQGGTDDMTTVTENTTDGIVYINYIEFLKAFREQFADEDTPSPLDTTKHYVISSNGDGYTNIEVDGKKYKFLNHIDTLSDNTDRDGFYNLDKMKEAFLDMDFSKLPRYTYNKDSNVMELTK